MDNKQKLYGISLDNYLYPEPIRTQTARAGTKEDLEGLAEMLEAYWWADENISAVATAIRGHFNGISNRDMVKKYGNYFSYVHDLDLLYESEPVVIEQHFWSHKMPNDAVYPMYAERIYIRRVIFRHRGALLTAIKGMMEGLFVCLQGKGWQKMRGSMSGHPEAVTYDPEEDIYEMRLFSVTGMIQPDEMENVIQSWDTETRDLEYLCQDIIAEGKILRAHPKDWLHKGK